MYLQSFWSGRYNIVVEFNDNRIGNYEFGGTIKDETLEQVLTRPYLFSTNKIQDHK